MGTDLIEPLGVTTRLAATEMIMESFVTAVPRADAGSEADTDEHDTAATNGVAEAGIGATAPKPATARANPAIRRRNRDFICVFSFGRQAEPISACTKNHTCG